MGHRTRRRNPLVDAAVVAAVILTLLVVLGPSALADTPLNPEDVLALAALLGIVFGPYRAHAWQWGRLRSALDLQPDERAGYTLLFGDLRPLTGTHGERAVRLVTRRHYDPPGKPWRMRAFWAWFVEVEVALEDHGDAFSLRITREGVGARFAKALGGEDVETGDAVFDATFRVRAEDAERARRVLADTFLRDSLTRLPRFLELRVDANRVMLVRKGGLANAERARAELDALARLADAVEATASARPVPAA